MTNKKTSPVVGTSRGKPITDADIERMAHEAEAGYDLTTLRPRGGRPPLPPRRRTPLNDGGRRADGAPKWGVKYRPFQVTGGHWRRLQSAPRPAAIVSEQV